MSGVPFFSSKGQRSVFELALCSAVGRNIFDCFGYLNYPRQGERSKHWRRLRDWSFCQSFSLCVHDNSSSFPHVIHNRQERWRPPVKTSTFYSSNV